MWFLVSQLLVAAFTALFCQYPDTFWNSTASLNNYDFSNKIVTFDFINLNTDVFSNIPSIGNTMGSFYARFMDFTVNFYEDDHMSDVMEDIENRNNVEWYSRHCSPLDEFTCATNETLYAYEEPHIDGDVVINVEDGSAEYHQIHFYDILQLLVALLKDVIISLDFTWMDVMRFTCCLCLLYMMLQKNNIDLKAAQVNFDLQVDFLHERILRSKTYKTKKKIRKNYEIFNRDEIKRQNLLYNGKTSTTKLLMDSSDVLFMTKLRRKTKSLLNVSTTSLLTSTKSFITSAKSSIIQIPSIPSGKLIDTSVSSIIHLAPVPIASSKSAYVTDNTMLRPIKTPLSDESSSLPTSVSTFTSSSN